MLAIFLFAISPHQFIHDAITHHRDTVDHFHPDTEVSHHHTHCDFLHVVHAPFTQVAKTFLTGIPFNHLLYKPLQDRGYNPETLFHFNLRGPPLS